MTHVPTSLSSVISTRGMLTTHERATAVINSSRITLDTKLGVFTVVGTKELRVVRLFPTPTCSCPAKGRCYHVVAACMSIGIHEAPPRRTINLTQLRKNVRKRPDKTSVRKRPRLHDVDVLAAGDADDATASTVAAAVRETTPDDLDDDDGDVDNCSACGLPEPPADKAARTKDVRWVQCETCPLWFHNVCVGLRASKTVKCFVCCSCR